MRVEVAVVPDILLGELKTVDPSALVRWGLQVAQLSSVEVAQLAAHRGPRGVSRTDLAALAVAGRLACALATDDHNLRKLAQARGVSLRGTLWVLDCLVDLRLLEPRRAAAGLQDMLRLDGRLPRAECAARLRRWT